MTASTASSPTPSTTVPAWSPEGADPAHLDQGWFYEPTVLDAPSNANPGAQREVFGPVVTVFGYRDIDEAVAIANDHELGLSAGVYTGDLAEGWPSPSASAGDRSDE